MVYKKVGGRDLHLYVVKPPDWKRTDRRPAMVFFHGGGRVEGPVSQFNEQSQYGHQGGCGYSRMGKRYQEFSPAQNITSNAPPAVVFLGTKDYLIPTAVAERFKANMEKAGVRCDLHLYQGQNHGFFNQEPYRTATLIEADRSPTRTVDRWPICRKMWRSFPCRS